MGVQRNELEGEIEVVRRAKEGSRSAMETLIRHFEDDIFKFFNYRLGDESDAADCSQEVFLKMLRGLQKYSNEGRLRSWLFTIARNELIDFTKRKNRVVAFASIEDGNSEEEAADESVGRREDVSAVRDCVARLPEHESEVLELRLGEDLTFQEIADVLGRPLNSVLSQMRRATGKMKKCLEKKGLGK